MSILERIPATSFRFMPWANGGGSTTEMAAGPDRHNWRWRISMARIEADGPFSPLPGVRRQLAPLDTALQLRFADGQQRDARRLEVLHFAGDPAPSCHLPEGPGRDFNLMLCDGVDGELLVRPLAGHMVVLPRADTRWFIYVLAGSAALSAAAEHLQLGTNEAAWAEPPAGGRVVIEGGGEIALVRITIPAVASDPLPETPAVSSAADNKLTRRDWPLPYVDALSERAVADIDLVVIHCTELPDLAMAREYGERVQHADGSGNSGHYYIERDGSIARFVDDTRVAHHTRGYNPRSIGIELVNIGRYPEWFDSRHQAMTEPYSDAQMRSLLALLAHLRQQSPNLRWIAGHEDLDTNQVPASDDPSLQVARKRDPGPLFPWSAIVPQCGLQRLHATTQAPLPRQR